MPADDEPLKGLALYEDFVDNLLAPASKQSHTDRVLTGAMGLSGESGELLVESCDLATEWTVVHAARLMDHIKKWQYQGHILNREKVMDELGDILFYMAVEAKANRFTLQDVMDHNMVKLMTRYPQGFDPNKSMHRESLACNHEFKIAPGQRIDQLKGVCIKCGATA